VEKSRQTILMGVVTRAHGIRGDVAVKWFGEDVAAVSSYKMFQDEQGTQEYRVTRTRPLNGDTFVAHFSGVDSRTDAEAMRGTSLFIDRTLFPQIEGDEFYLVDLIGLKVIDDNRQPFGHVSEIHNFGAGDVIEIAPADGSASIMVPFTHDFVPEIESGQYIVLVMPEEAKGEGSPS
jgi:16S rRNA processing protein RimM